MQNISKSWVALALILVVMGGGFLFYIQKRALSERLYLEEQQSQIERRVRDLPSEMTPPVTWQRPTNFVQGNVPIGNFAFSPDGRFLAGIVQHETTPELAIWPISGGATLVRHSYETYGPSSFHWRGANHLAIGQEVWRIHKLDGKWVLSKAGMLPLMSSERYPSRSRQNFADFPRQDIRLQVEDLEVKIQGGVQAERGLVAYALSSGKRLPLPREIESKADLSNVKPLARWGKEPLKLARWLDGALLGINARSVVEVWDARAKKRLWSKQLSHKPGKLLVGEAGRVVIIVAASSVETSRGLRGIDIYDARTGTLLAQKHEQRMEVEGVVVSPNGQYLAIKVERTVEKKTGSYLLILDAKNLKELKKVSIFGVPFGAGSRGFSFSQDGRKLVVNIAKGLKIYDWQRADANGKTPFRQATL